MVFKFNLQGLFLPLVCLVGFGFSDGAFASFTLPAEQIQGCPWDDDWEQESKAKARAKSVKIGNDWYDISGTSNRTAFATHLKRCNVGAEPSRGRSTAAASAFTDWQKTRRYKKGAVWGGLAAGTVYGVVCGLLQAEAIGNDPTKQDKTFCWVGAGVYPAPLGLGGLILVGTGLAKKPEAKRKKYLAEVNGYMNYKRDLVTNAVKSMRDLSPRCHESNPRGLEETLLARDACNSLSKVMTNKEVAVGVEEVKTPSLKATQRQAYIWDMQAMSSLCDWTIDRDSSEDIAKGIQHCKKLINVWKSKPGSLEDLAVLDRETAEARLEMGESRKKVALRQEESPERKAEEARAAESCNEIYSAFVKGKSSQKQWLSCCTESVLKNKTTAPAVLMRECK